MFEAVIEVSFFLKLVESLKDIVREVYLKFSQKGMTVQSMDPAKVAYVSLFLEKEGFDIYKCPKPTKIGIDLEYFGNILRLCKSPNDKLTLRLEETQKSGTDGLAADQTQSGKFNFIYIVLKNIYTSRETEFTMKLVNFEDFEFKIPKLNHESLLCMRSADFTRICRDLGNISDNVSIELVNKGIKLSVVSDIADGSVSISDHESEEEKNDKLDPKLISDIEAGNKNVVQFLSQLSLSHEEKPSEETEKDENSKKPKDKHEFSLKYINIFNKGMAFSPIIKIHISFVKEDKDPMVMEFKIGDTGEIKYKLFYI